MRDWALVIPTNRPDKFVEFMSAWWTLFQEHAIYIIVVEDSPTKSDSIAQSLTDFQHQHLCWDDVPEFFPRRSDMIRAYGFYPVHETKLARHILTLDDDVVPLGDPIKEYETVFDEGAPLSEFLDVGALTDSGLQMRGFPYKDRLKREVSLQYGGRSGVLDYDAATQLSQPQPRKDFSDIVMPVPKGSAVTGCIMNCAFKTDIVPLMWQLILLDGRHNRVGDIWSCLFAKKVLDNMSKVVVVNGKAKVLHNRASDPYNSLAKEATSVRLNDDLWYHLKCSGNDMIEGYIQVTAHAAQYFAGEDSEYANAFIEGRDKWLSLFE